MPYFCPMNKWIGIILLIFAAAQGFGQIRLDKLEIKARQAYTIEESDVLVVDTLIMRDSSRIVLNKEKSENIINVKVLIVNRGAQIIGNGANGEAGKGGAHGVGPKTPPTGGGTIAARAPGGHGARGLEFCFLA